MTIHVTYIRRSDRTRIVYVLPESDPQTALDHAASMAPPDFKLAAYREHPGGRMHVPQDGDDYGEDRPPPQPLAVLPGGH